MMGLGGIKSESDLGNLVDGNDWDEDKDDDDNEDEREKTKRKSRNQSEKKRRDQFNILINELMTLVAGTNRKMDKSTVLQATISFLKRNKEMSSQHCQQEEVTEKLKPKYISNAEFSQLMLEALDGFLIAISKSGQVIYCSENVTPVLGHTPENIMNESFFQLVHEAERSEIFQKLSQGQHSEQPQQPNNILANNTESQFPVPQGMTQSTIDFNCHLKRGNPEIDESNGYEQCSLTGTFRRFTQNTFCGLNNLMDVSNEDSTCFVGICKLVSPLFIKDISITDKTPGEFGVRLSLEGKFVYVDGKSSSSLGYSSLELLGKSYFEYIHVDDLDKIEDSFGKLNQCGEIQAPMYRLMTKGRQWLWVQPRLYLQYHQWSRKAESINVTHYVVTYQDVLSHLQKEKKAKERERAEMKVYDAAKAHQLAAVNAANAAAAVKFEIKDMQLPAITIDPSGDASGVRIPKFGDAEEQENDIEKVREEARQKENRYLEIISHYEEELKKYKEELNIYQRREKESKSAEDDVSDKVKQNDPDKKNTRPPPIQATASNPTPRPSLPTQQNTPTLPTVPSLPTPTATTTPTLIGSTNPPTSLIGQSVTTGVPSVPQTVGPGQTASQVRQQFIRPNQGIRQSQYEHALNQMRNSVFTNPLANLGIPMPNLNSFTGQIPIPQLNIPRMSVPPHTSGDMSYFHVQNQSDNQRPT